MSTFTKARLAALHRLAKDNPRLKDTEHLAYSVSVQNRYAGYQEVSRYLVTNNSALVCLSELPESMLVADTVPAMLVSQFQQCYLDAIALPVSITRDHLAQWSREEKAVKAKQDGSRVLLHLCSEGTIRGGESSRYEAYFNPVLVRTCIKAMGSGLRYFLVPWLGKYSALIIRPVDGADADLLDGDFAAVLPVNPSSLEHTHVLEVTA